MKRVLVLAGTPGVGKSSVSSLLTSRLCGILVSLGNLVRHEGLSCGLDKNRGTLIADSERVSKRVRGIIEQTKGYVIVDGHFAMDVVAAEDVFLAFVLRRNPDELREILKERGFKEGKIAENVAAEILDVCLFDAVKAYGEKKVCEVDVSGRTVEEVVDEIMCVVNGRSKCRVGVVDWLTKLESEGRLDEFLV
ncbi:MAG: adenylate kinase family protein [Candidatus Bathyarchaeota archaeon]|nr:adenylate kinase family protein [Candidatus Bathyarchaeota archaeon]MDH5494555.1 adenylate kinase family protein [Candidatus Bathyarchaeota archaeon]